MQPSSDYIFQTAGEGLEHDPAKHAFGLDPMGADRFSLSITSAERGCAEMLKQ